MVETCDFVKLGNSQAPRKPWERGWETLESIFIPSKCFSICSGNNACASWKANFVSATLFPEKSKQGNTDRKQNISATMFPSLLRAQNIFAIKNLV